MAIALAHESHQGVDKTKALIREKIWYPHIDERIKEMVDYCMPRLATSSDVKPEPLKLTEMPKEPWEKIHLDFKGPLPGGKYLFVVIDRYTRYPEVEIMTSIVEQQVTKKLRKIFASHGLPKVVVTDNGPPFHSKEFENNTKEWGITHVFSTPY